MPSDSYCITARALAVQVFAGADGTPYAAPRLTPSFLPIQRLMRPHLALAPGLPASLAPITPAHLSHVSDN